MKEHKYRSWKNLILTLFFIFLLAIIIIVDHFKIPSLNLNAFHVIAKILKKEIYILSDFNYKRLILLLCRNACTDNKAGRESGWRLLYWDTRVQLVHELPFWQMHLYMQMRDCLLEIVLNTNGCSINFQMVILNVRSEKQTETMFTISKQMYKNWKKHLDTCGTLTKSECHFIRYY